MRVPTLLVLFVAVLACAMSFAQIEVNNPILQAVPKEAIAAANTWFRTTHANDKEIRRWSGLSTDGYVADVVLLAGIKCYDITSDTLINGDWLVPMRTYSVLCYEDTHGKLVRLNLRPICWQPCGFEIRKGEPPLKVLSKFLRQAGITESALTRRQFAELFILGVCHNWPGEFPKILLTSDDCSRGVETLSGEQRAFLPQLRPAEGSTKSYVVITEYPNLKHVAKYSFTFSKNNHLVSVEMITLR